MFENFCANAARKLKIQAYAQFVISSIFLVIVYLVFAFKLEELAYRWEFLEALGYVLDPFWFFFIVAGVLGVVVHSMYIKALHRVAEAEMMENVASIEDDTNNFRFKGLMVRDFSKEDAEQDKRSLNNPETQKSVVTKESDYLKKFGV